MEKSEKEVDFFLVLLFFPLDHGCLGRAVDDRCHSITGQKFLYSIVETFIKRFGGTSFIFFGLQVFSGKVLFEFCLPVSVSTREKERDTL